MALSSRLSYPRHTTSPFLGMQVVGLAVISVDSPGAKARSAGTVVWLESPRKNGRKRHLGGPFLTTWTPPVGNDSIGSGIVWRSLCLDGVVPAREGPRCFKRLFGCGWSTERERRGLKPGFRLTSAPLTLSTGLDLATSGAELSGVVDHGDSTKSFPPTGVDGEPGAE